MLSDLLFYLLSEQLARASAPGTRPEKADAILHELEMSLHDGEEEGGEDREHRRPERPGLLDLDLVSEYLRTVPQAFSEEAHAWFLERAAREPGWPRAAGPDAVVVRYVTTADPLNRFIATAAQLAAQPVDRWSGETPPPSVAPIANALLEMDAFPREGSEPAGQTAGPTPRERADSIAELTEMVLDLTLGDLRLSTKAIGELVRLVREHPQVQEYNPVGRVLLARAEQLGGEEERLLREIARTERENYTEEEF